MAYRDKPLAALVCAMAVWLAATAARAEDWPQWRGPNHDGTTGEKITAAWPLKPLWTKDVGEGYSSVAVSGGRAYATGWKDGTHRLYCLDPATGKEIWSHKYAADAGPTPVGPRATPTVSGGKVYALDSVGKLYCCDAVKGTVLWWKNIIAELGVSGYHKERGVSTSPIIEGSLILLNVGDAGGALNKDTGAKAWCNGTDIGSFASAFVYTSGPDRIAAMLMRKKAVGVNAVTGNLVWSFDLAESTDVSAADLIVAGDKVLVSTGYFYGRCAAYTLGKGNLAQAWRKDGLLGSRNTANVLYKGYVYGFDGNSSRLVCMDPQTGQPMWAQPDFSDRSAVVVAGGQLVLVTWDPRRFPSHASDLIVAEASPSGYKEIHRQTLIDFAGGGNVFALSIAGGRLFCRNQAGTVVCLDAGAAPVGPAAPSAPAAPGTAGVSATDRTAPAGHPTDKPAPR